MITYKPLWKQLVDKKMNKTDFRKKIGISTGTLATMGKDKYIAMSIIDKICNILDCEIEDIIKYEKE